MKRVLAILILGGVLVAATPRAFGGWATVTLLEVPEYLEVGTATTISFKIRQHGETVVWDREPALILGGAGLFARVFKQDRVRAHKSDVHGVYEATITPERAGELSVTVDTDVYGWEVQLLPFDVVDSDHGPVMLSDAARGSQLFVAKGCATCHTKLDDDALSGIRTAAVGPSLTARVFAQDYLAMKIKNPAEGRTASTGDFVMPQLELDVPEIEALVRYLNGSRATDEGAAVETSR